MHSSLRLFYGRPVARRGAAGDASRHRWSTGPRWRHWHRSAPGRDWKTDEDARPAHTAYIRAGRAARWTYALRESSRYRRRCAAILAGSRAGHDALPVRCPGRANRVAPAAKATALCYYWVALLWRYLAWLMPEF